MKSWEQVLGRLLSALRLDSIRSKIVALAVVATLAPALSTAVLSYVQNRRALTETLEGELHGIGSQAAREIDLWVKERFYDVRVFVSSFEVSENLDRLPGGGPGAAEALTRLTNYLTGVQGRFPDYVELLVLDVEGVPVASSAERVRTVELPDGWEPRLRQRETLLGEPFVDADVDSVAVRVAQPIESTDARFLGTLVATLTFGAVQAVLADLAPGEDGRVELILSDGRRIVGSAPGEALESALPVGVLAGLRADPEGTLEYAPTPDAPVLGSLTTVPRLDWFVVTSIPTEEAYAQVTRLRNSTALLVSGLLVVVGALAYLLGLFIVRPLDRLATGARAVSRGDLSVDLPVTGGGEVGYLTQVFNRMVAQLRRHREELADANAALREHNVELERLSMTDALTGLYNRRYVMNELEKEIARASRHDRVLAVLMLDVDRFKLYNDTHGHLAGDQVLTAMGRVIEDATREDDVPGRFGGEEFIALLPDCDLQGAMDAAERIRARLTEEVFEGGEVTCSIGAASYPDHGDEPSTLIEAADTALYAAKESGRDRVVAAEARGRRKPKVDPTTKRRARPTTRKADADAPSDPGSAGKDRATSAQAQPAEEPATKTATASKAAAKAGAKKAGAKKSAARKATGKSPAKESAAKPPSKKSPAKKSPTKKGAAGKSTADGDRASAAGGSGGGSGSAPRKKRG